MNFTIYLNARRSCVTLMCLLLVVNVTVYIVTERQEMVHYVPDTEFEFSGTSNTPTNQSGHVVNNEWSNVSTTKKYSFSDSISEKELVKLFAKYKNNRKSMSENVSRVERKTELMKESGKKKTYFFLNQSYPPEQRERVARIERICKERELLSEYVFYGHNSTFYYYSSEYDFSYCKVPKSGSTFWTQVFGILKHGAEDASTLFSKKRSRVHFLMKQFMVDFWSDQRKNSLSILVSRDPFSRLHSAFIDKSYLLLVPDINFHIRLEKPTGHNRFCPVDVTFQEFLDFVIRSARKGRILNRHWAPIYSLCRPCDVNAYILVKQESFSNDVEQALRAFGVENDKIDVIMPALHDHRAETTIPGIIQTVYSRFENSKVRNCVDGKNIAKRLWTSFKIQGYLKGTLKFPSQMLKYESQYYNKTHVTNVIINNINSHKMTSLEMKRQRHRALVDAYSEIKDATIKGIKEVYKIDFEMFDYPTDPPTVDQR